MDLCFRKIRNKRFLIRKLFILMILFWNSLNFSQRNVLGLYTNVCISYCSVKISTLDVIKFLKSMPPTKEFELDHAPHLVDTTKHILNYENCNDTICRLSLFLYCTTRQFLQQWERLSVRYIECIATIGSYYRIYRVMTQQCTKGWSHYRMWMWLMAGILRRLPRVREHLLSGRLKNLRHLNSIVGGGHI